MQRPRRPVFHRSRSQRNVLDKDAVLVRSLGEEYQSPLLGHTCSGHHHHHHHHGEQDAESGNVVHRFLAKRVASLPMMKLISVLHHRLLGICFTLAGFSAFLAPITSCQPWLRFIGMSVVLGFSGVPVFLNSLLQVSQLTVDASVLMSLSAIGSIYLGMAGEGLLLLLLFQISHFLEAKFTNQSKTSLQDLLDSVPDQATVVNVHSATLEPIIDSVEIRDAVHVTVGTHILVKPGEQVPLDSVVVSGIASLTVEHISGESLPITVRPGSHVAAGSHNADGLLVLRTIATVVDSTPTRIARLAIEAQKRKPDMKRWLDGLTAVWSECALLAAFVIVVGNVMVGVPWFGARGALYRSLCIVTAAAPCALILTPLAYVCALANASRRNILIKSATVLDTIRNCSYVALDKTGTLTDGKLVCTNIVTAEDIIKHKAEIRSADAITGSPLKHRALCHAVDLSKRSTHPVAAAIVEAGRRHLPSEDGNCSVSDFELVPGCGVRGTINSRFHNRPLLANLGSLEFIQEQLSSDDTGQDLEKAMDSVTDIYGKSVSVLTTRDSDGSNLEWSAFCFRDELQAVSKAAVQYLREGRWKTGQPQTHLAKHVAIITGDNETSAHLIGKRLDISDIYSKHKPEDKLKFIHSTQKALEEAHGEHSGLVMVGDGINDAPALTQANVGISISETASDLSASASDIVILNGQGVANLPFLFLLADRLRTVVIQNLVIAFSAMAIVCLPSLRGWMPLWLSVLLHEGSTLLTAINSCRLLFLTPKKLEK